MSRKQLDAKNRWRNKTVAFRVSPEEAQVIDRLVSLSGLNKQDYLIARCLQQEVTVVPNIRVQRNLHQILSDIRTCLDTSQNLPADLAESLSMLTNIVTQL